MSAPRAPRGGTISGRYRPTLLTGHRGRGSARESFSTTPADATHSRGRGHAPAMNARVGGPLRSPQAGTSNRRGDGASSRGAGSRRATGRRESSMNSLHRGAISNSWAKRSAALKTNDDMSYNDFINAVEKRYTELKAKRATDRARAIQEGMLADPDKKVTLDQAITPVGTCTEMCPEFERLERMKQMMVDGAEKVFNGKWDRDMPVEERMVKRFRRSAAGYDEQLPSDIRTPATLKATLDYLFDEVIGRAENLATIQKFVWDRTRSIRNDFSIQQVTEKEDVASAVECFERIARFHILSLHQLSNPAASVGGDYFDAHQEREQLNNTLLSLMYYYDDNRDRMDFRNEAEFRAYCIIFEIQSQHPDLEDRMQSWPKPLLQDKRVQTAFRLYSAAGNTLYNQGPLRPFTPFSVAKGNSTGFWRLLSSNSVSYLMACVGEIYFGQVRYVALQNIWTNVKSSPSTRQSTEEWTAGELTKALAFDEDDQTIDFLDGFDLELKTNSQGQKYLDFTCQSSTILEKSAVVNKQVFSARMVEKKRMRRTLTAVANGLTVAQAIREGAVFAEQEQSSDQDTTNASSKVQESEESIFIPEVDSSSDAGNTTKPTSIFNPKAPSFTPASDPLGGQSHSSTTNSVFGKPFTSTVSSSTSTSPSIFGKPFSPQPPSTLSSTTSSNFNAQTPKQTFPASVASKSSSFGQPSQVYSPPGSGLSTNESASASVAKESVSPKTLPSDLPDSSHTSLQAGQSSGSSSPLAQASSKSHLADVPRSTVSEAETTPPLYDLLDPAVATNLKSRGPASTTNGSLFDRVEPSPGSPGSFTHQTDVNSSPKTGSKNPFHNIDFSGAPQHWLKQNESPLTNGDTAAPSDDAAADTHGTFGIPTSFQGFPSSQQRGIANNDVVRHTIESHIHASSSHDQRSFSSPAEAYNSQSASTQAHGVFGTPRPLQETYPQSQSTPPNGQVFTESVNGMSLSQAQEQFEVARQDLVQNREVQQVDLQRLQQMKTELERYEQEIFQKEAEVNQQEQEVTERRTSLDKSTRQLHQKTTEIDSLTNFIKAMEKEICQLRDGNECQHTQLAKQLEEAVNSARDLAISEKDNSIKQERKDSNLRAQKEALRIQKLDLENAKLKAQQKRYELKQKQESKQLHTIFQTEPASVSIQRNLAEQAINNLSQTAFLEEHGILQQYVEHACASPIKQAIKAYRQEQEISKVRPYREHLLKFKYGRRWRSRWWKRHMVRKGQESRARLTGLRKSIREEGRHKATLEAQEKAILEEAKISEDIMRQISENSERKKRERQQARKAKRDADRAIAEDIAWRAGYSMSAGKKSKPTNVNKIGKDESWKTGGPLSGRERNSQPASNNTYRTSLTPARTPVANNAGNPVAASSMSFPAMSQNSEGLVRPKIPRWTPQYGWRPRHQDHRRNIDTTETDYFRLKARGIDPETPFVPDTKKILEGKKARAEQQAHKDESKSFASSFIKKNQDPPGASITMSMTSDSAASRMIPESIARADKILEGLQQIGAQLDKDIGDMRETNAELRKQRDAKLQSRYSSSPRDFSTSPLTPSERSFTPGQMATVNGHAFIPGRFITRSEARLRMTGGSGLAYRDPADFEDEIEQRYKRVKRVLKSHKPLTIDDIDKKHSLGKYASGYAPIGNESPEPFDSGDRLSDTDEPVAVTVSSPVIIGSGGRKRKRAPAPPAARRYKKHRSHDGTYIYESDSEDEAENLDQQSVTQANKELQYLPSYESIVHNAGVIDPALGIGAPAQEEDGDDEADAEGEFDVHGDDETGFDEDKDGYGNSNVYRDDGWEGEAEGEEYYDGEQEQEQEEYDEEEEGADDNDESDDDQEDISNNGNSGRIYSRAGVGVGFGHEVEARFTPTPSGAGASQDDAIELSD